jgi:hypothetical protein
MVVRSLVYLPRENNEKTFGPKVLHLSAIGILMYLANNMRPDITLPLWDGIKHVLRYLCGTRDMRLFYRKDTKSKVVGYVYPYKTRSQSGYVFPYGDTAILWRSTK